MLETELIPREKIINLLFHPVEENKGITQEQFEEICIQYPIVQKVYSVTWKFKRIVKNKNVEGLQEWIKITK